MIMAKEAVFASFVLQKSPSQKCKILTEKDIDIEKAVCNNITDNTYAEVIFMNLYIMVDLEGISGIFSRDQITDDPVKIQEGRVMMTEDINACVDAAKEAGVDKIYVRDCHGTSRTGIYERLSENAD